jgi:hypothetical protein
MTDFNDANEQRPDGVIPDGTYCQLRLTWRPGNENLEGCFPDDIGLFKTSSTSSDVVYLDAELAVTFGLYAGRKLWQNFTVSGGKQTEGGTSKAWNISKDTMRAMIDSALGLDPKDVSAAAKAKRNLPSFRSLDGVAFFARLGVESGGGVYADKNRVAHIVVPGEPQYAALKAGQEVPPAPSGVTAARAAAAPAQAKPAWQQNAVEVKPATTSAGPSWLTGERK